MITVCMRGRLGRFRAGSRFNARRFTRSGGGGTLPRLSRFARRSGFHSQHAVDQRTAGKNFDRYKYRHGADVPE